MSSLFTSRLYPFASSSLSNSNSNVGSNSGFGSGSGSGSGSVSGSGARHRSLGGAFTSGDNLGSEPASVSTSSGPSLAAAAVAASMGSRSLQMAGQSLGRRHNDGNPRGMVGMMRTVGTMEAIEVVGEDFSHELGNASHHGSTSNSRNDNGRAFSHGDGSGGYEPNTNGNRMVHASRTSSRKRPTSAAGWSSEMKTGAEEEENQVYNQGQTQGPNPNPTSSPSPSTTSGGHLQTQRQRQSQSQSHGATSRAPNFGTSHSQYSSGPSNSSLDFQPPHHIQHPPTTVVNVAHPPRGSQQPRRDSNLAENFTGGSRHINSTNNASIAHNTNNTNSTSITNNGLSNTMNNVISASAHSQSQAHAQTRSSISHQPVQAARNYTNAHGSTANFTAAMAPPPPPQATSSTTTSTTVPTTMARPPPMPVPHLSVSSMSSISSIPSIPSMSSSHSISNSGPSLAFWYLSNSTGMGSNGNVASNHQTASFEGGPQTSNQVSTQSEDENVGQVRLHRRNTLDSEPSAGFTPAITGSSQNEHNEQRARTAGGTPTDDYRMSWTETQAQVQSHHTGQSSLGWTFTPYTPNLEVQPTSNSGLNPPTFPTPSHEPFSYAFPSHSNSLSLSQSHSYFSTLPASHSNAGSNANSNSNSNSSNTQMHSRSQSQSHHNLDTSISQIGGHRRLSADSSRGVTSPFDFSGDHIPGPDDISSSGEASRNRNHGLANMANSNHIHNHHNHNRSGSGSSSNYYLTSGLGSASNLTSNSNLGSSVQRNNNVNSEQSSILPLYLPSWVSAGSNFLRRTFSTTASNNNNNDTVHDNHTSANISNNIGPSYNNNYSFNSDRSNDTTPRPLQRRTSGVTSVPMSMPMSGPSSTSLASSARHFSPSSIGIYEPRIGIGMGAGVAGAVAGAAAATENFNLRRSMSTSGSSGPSRRNTDDSRNNDGNTSGHTTYYTSMSSDGNQRSAQDRYRDMDVDMDVDVDMASQSYRDPTSMARSMLPTSNPTSTLRLDDLAEPSFMVPVTRPGEGEQQAGGRGGLRSSSARNDMGSQAQRVRFMMEDDHADMFNSPSINPSNSANSFSATAGATSGFPGLQASFSSAPAPRLYMGDSGLELRIPEPEMAPRSLRDHPGYNSSTLATESGPGLGLGSAPTPRERNEPRRVSSWRDSLYNRLVDTDSFSHNNNPVPSTIGIGGSDSLTPRDQIEADIVDMGLSGSERTVRFPHRRWDVRGLEEDRERTRRELNEILNRSSPYSVMNTFEASASGSGSGPGTGPGSHPTSRAHPYMPNLPQNRQNQSQNRTSGNTSSSSSSLGVLSRSRQHPPPTSGASGLGGVPHHPSTFERHLEPVRPASPPHPRIPFPSPPARTTTATNNHNRSNSNSGMGTFNSLRYSPPYNPFDGPGSGGYEAPTWVPTRYPSPISPPSPTLPPSPPFYASRPFPGSAIEPGPGPSSSTLRPSSSMRNDRNDRTDRIDRNDRSDRSMAARSRLRNRRITAALLDADGPLAWLDPYPDDDVEGLYSSVTFAGLEDDLDIDSLRGLDGLSRLADPSFADPGRLGGPSSMGRNRRGPRLATIRRMMSLNRMRALGDYVLDEDFDDSYEALVALTQRIGAAKKGCSNETLADLPSGTYAEFSRAKNGVVGDSESCAICLEDYKIEDACLKLSRCSHFYHKECVKEWLKSAKTCPVCRETVEGAPRAQSSGRRPAIRQRSHRTPNPPRNNNNNNTGPSSGTNDRNPRFGPGPHRRTSTNDYFRADSPAGQLNPNFNPPGPGSVSGSGPGTSASRNESDRLRILARSNFLRATTGASVDHRDHRDSPRPDALLAPPAQISQSGFGRQAVDDVLGLASSDSNSPTSNSPTSPMYGPPATRFRRGPLARDLARNDSPEPYRFS